MNKQSRTVIPKPLQELTLFDRFLFREAMDVPELFQTFIDILFERHIEFLDRAETEKEIGISPQLRSIRLDVFNTSEDGQVYNVEMQKANTYNLPKRSRFYQSQIDVGMLPAGCINFNLLRDSYLIMICGFDLFGKGLYRYTFQSVCEECSELNLNNGQYQIFINTKGRKSEAHSTEFLELMDYLNASASQQEQYTETEAVRKLHEGVLMLKKNEEIGVKYMQEWEERIMEQEKAREEGHEKGREEGYEEFASLTAILLNESKFEELKRAASDKSYRNELYKIYHITL